MGTLPEIKTKIEVRLQELENERQQLMQMLALVNNNPVQGSQVKLADTIKKVLEESSPLPLRDIFQKLKDAGHVFRGKNPKMSVYSAMARHPEVFQKSDNGWAITSVKTKPDKNISKNNQKT